MHQAATVSITRNQLNEADTILQCYLRDALRATRCQLGAGTRQEIPYLPALLTWARQEIQQNPGLLYVDNTDIP